MTTIALNLLKSTVGVLILGTVLWDPPFLQTHVPGRLSVLPHKPPGDETCVQSPCEVMIPEQHEKWIVAALGWSGQAEEEMKGRAVHAWRLAPRTTAINKPLNDHRKWNKMSQSSGTGYGINPFGEARSAHASTTTTTPDSIEHHRSLSPHPGGDGNTIWLLYQSIGGPLTTVKSSSVTGT